MAQRDYGDWQYGWAFGLALGAWLLNVVATLSLLMQSPGRDLKAGERLAADTVHGRRGSFADIFTRGFWTGGAGQPWRGGEREEASTRDGLEESELDSSDFDSVSILLLAPIAMTDPMLCFAALRVLFCSWPPPLALVCVPPRSSLRPRRS
jgi:hypothetical protein